MALEIGVYFLSCPLKLSVELRPNLRASPFKGNVRLWHAATAAATSTSLSIRVAVEETGQIFISVTTQLL